MTARAGYEIQTVSRVTRVPVATLNVWINRSIIAARPTSRGKARLFDLETVFRIALVGVLVPLGQPAPFAASAAAYAARKKFERPGAKLVIGPPRHVGGVQNRMTGTPTVTFVAATTPDELERELRKFSDGRPDGAIIVDLNQIAVRVRRELELFGGRREPTPEHEAKLELMQQDHGNGDGAEIPITPPPPARSKRRHRSPKSEKP
jgi:hypothetical protein